MENISTINKADLWILTEKKPIQKQIKQKKLWWISSYTLKKKPSKDIRMALEWNPQELRNCVLEMPGPIETKA